MLDLIYPVKCPFCGKILLNEEKKEGACWDCMPQPFPYEGEAILDRIHVSFLYEGKVKEAVDAFKYEGMRTYAVPFGAFMVREGQTFVEGIDVDVVSAVPISKERKRQRGYNQAELLAREVAKRLNKPYLEVATRGEKTRALKALGRAMRKKELEKAFLPVSYLEDFKGKGLRILLIDDILTTGATLESVRDAVKSVLPDAKVYGWAFCQDLMEGS